MAKTLKDKITHIVDEVSARARDIAKSIGLVPNPPQLAPIPIPTPQVRRRS